MASSLNFNGVTNYGDCGPSDQLEFSVVNWMQAAFLNIGAFSNITIGESGAYGGQASQLQHQRDLYYTDGQVWQGFRQDWVWETGVDYPVQPIHVSGIWVNGVFQHVGTSGWFINYHDGKVVFDQPQPLGDTISCEYSYRNVQVVPPDAPWFQAIQYNTFRPDDSQYTQLGSGSYNVLAQNRVQMPAIVVEAKPFTRNVGLELGSAARVQNQDVYFNIFAETPFDRNQLFDILMGQEEKSITGIDKNKMLASGAFPLDENGSLVSGALMYPDLISQFPWKTIRVVSMKMMEFENTPRLYTASIRGTFELFLP